MDRRTDPKISKKYKKKVKREVSLLVFFKKYIAFISVFKNIEDIIISIEYDISINDIAIIYDEEIIKLPVAKTIDIITIPESFITK